MKKAKISKTQLFSVLDEVVSNLGQNAPAIMTPGTGEQIATPKAFAKKDYQKEVTALEKSKADKLLAIAAKNVPGYVTSLRIHRDDPYSTYESLYKWFKALTGKDPKEFDSTVEAPVAGLEESIDAPNTDHVLAALNTPELTTDVKKTLFNGYKQNHISAETVLKIVKDLTSKGKTVQTEGYNRFQSEIKVRNKPEQMHEAIKAVNKRLHEINKILEYASELKSELSESNGDYRHGHRTEEMLHKMKNQVAEAYSKLKKLY